MSAEINAGDAPEGDAPKVSGAGDQQDITVDTAHGTLPGETPAQPSRPVDTTAGVDDASTAAERLAPAGSPHGERPTGGSESLTPGGYSYVVVDDAEEPQMASEPAPRRRRKLPWLIALALIPAAIVGVAVWFFTSGSGGSSSERQNADVTSVLNLFGSQQGVAAKRYEGTLAPGYPGDVPTYPGARLVSSIRQVRGEDAQYYAVYDTTDARRKVAQYFEDQLNNDPWQLEGGQTSLDSTIHQFGRVDSSDLSGIVLVAESEKDRVTTILTILQVVSGAKDAPKQTFSPAGVDGRLPVGFPDTVPAYPGSNTIQSAYQKQSGARTYAASWVTKDDASSALSYYRDTFTSNGWTVQDADTSQTPSATAGQSIQFTDANSKVSGSVTVGQFEQDDSYTRIDVQVTVPNSAASGG